jgi:PhzF family phenazine biosynthesis protein
MTGPRCYKVVDVFTAQPLLGNPVAVVLDAQGLDTAQMQRIANWTNLSETTFVLPPTASDADYRLRIFTPRSELPFAGHPTLGSAHAVLEAGRVAPRPDGRLVQQCEVGLVELKLTGQGGDARLSFGLPPTTLRPMEASDIEELTSVFGCRGGVVSAPAMVDVGPIWVVVHLADAAAVLALRPDLGRLAQFENRLGITGVTVFGARPEGGASIEVRTFAPSCGVNEDPVCGSGNGSVAAFRWARGLLPQHGADYVALQGRCVGRDGRVDVSVNASGQIHIGGACVTCIDGSLALRNMNTL